ncbi:MAG TPA: tetratricopeptide repeat protein [Desulfatiglandales bacterium]|nr:tetratricopeptide repeat protein [Desulfatiglandales bacterium]
MSFRFKIKDFHISSIVNINQPWWPYFIISLLVVLVYLPSLNGGFILDDSPLIKNNPYVKEMKSIASYLAQEDGITDKRDTGTYHTGYYRPLINITYWIDYKLWGMNAAGFRKTNLAFHILTCLLLYKLLTSLGSNKEAAFWSTLLFGLHPVNTESVSWIISRNNTLVTLFVLSSFYFYIIGWERADRGAMIFSMLSLIGAILSKEFGLMIVPIFFLYHRVLSKERGNVLKELTTYLQFIVILFFYFTLRMSVTSSLLTPSDMGGILRRIYFSPYLIIWNLKLIFFPHGLHSFGLSYPHSYFEWDAVISIILVFLMGALLWVARNKKLLLFSGLSFLVFLFPVLNIIPTASISLIAMRWLYLPLAFISIGMAWIIDKAILNRRMLTISLLCITGLYFGIYSYLLNKNLWHDEETFFKQEIFHFNNYLYAGGFADNLLDKKDFKEAKKYFQIAISKYPYMASNYLNYSALLIETGKPDDALSYLKRAESLTMTCSEQGQWFNNTGMAYFKLKNNNDVALKNFKKAVMFCPNEPQFRANLGGAYGSAGDYINSITVLKQGLNLFQDSIILRKNLAISYYRMGDYSKTISVLEKIPFDRRQEDHGIIGLLKDARNMIRKNLCSRHELVLKNRQ